MMSAALDLAEASVATGAAFGLVHAVIAGTMLGAVPRLHPLIRAGRTEAPGPFGWSLSAAKAVGFLLLHLVFGVVVAAVH